MIKYKIYKPYRVNYSVEMKPLFYFPDRSKVKWIKFSTINYAVSPEKARNNILSHLEVSQTIDSITHGVKPPYRVRVDDVEEIRV